MTDAHATLPEIIIQLLKHLGLERAHFAACMPRRAQTSCPMGWVSANTQKAALPVSQSSLFFARPVQGRSQIPLPRIDRAR